MTDESLLGPYSFLVSQTGSMRYSAESSSPIITSALVTSPSVLAATFCLVWIEQTDRPIGKARHAVLWEKERGQLEEAESNRLWLAFWLDLIMGW